MSTRLQCLVKILMLIFRQDFEAEVWSLSCCWSLVVVMTQCKIEFTYASHCVSKNLTPCRMLKKCFWWLKLTAGTIAFRICMTRYRPKLTVGLGKLCKIKHLKQGNQWKPELFRKLLCTRKFPIGKFFGASGHGILTHSGYRKFIWKEGTKIFDPVLVVPNRVSATKCGPLAKKWGVTKNVNVFMALNMQFIFYCKETVVSLS